MNTNEVGKYLEGATIEKMYGEDGFEGGLTIVFDRDGERGIYIMGYTELGEWVEHFQHGDTLYSDEYDKDIINKVRLTNGFDKI